MVARKANTARPLAVLRHSVRSTSQGDTGLFHHCQWSRLFWAATRLSSGHQSCVPRWLPLHRPAKQPRPGTEPRSTSQRSWGGLLVVTAAVVLAAALLARCPRRPRQVSRPVKPSLAMVMGLSRAHCQHLRLRVGRHHHKLNCLGHGVSTAWTLLPAPSVHRAIATLSDSRARHRTLSALTARAPVTRQRKRETLGLVKPAAIFCDLPPPYRRRNNLVGRLAATRSVPSSINMLCPWDREDLGSVVATGASSHAAISPIMTAPAELSHHAH